MIRNATRTIAMIGIKPVMDGSFGSITLEATRSCSGDLYMADAIRFALFIRRAGHAD
jgi:hypothetical protein